MRIPARGSDAVRAALVDAAAKLLGDMGPRALSVRDIARRAGVNHGQVHHYFGSKRALLEAAMRKLAQEHYHHARELAADPPIPPALSLARDPAYWRAVCQVVMDGDRELAGIEVEEDISVPRRVLHELTRRWGVSPDDLDFKARFAALVALNLGWVAFEDFALLAADVAEVDRDEVRERLEGLLESLATRRATWTSD